MIFSAPRVEVVSSPNSSQEQYAGQPEEVSNKRLARGFRRSVAAASTIPPLVAIASVLPLGAQGAVIVTAWSALALVYVLSTLARMRSDLQTGERKWNELCSEALAIEQAHERLKGKYNKLYAAYIEQRGAIPLVAKRKRGTAADSPSGVNGSAADVVEFPKGAGA